MKQKFIKIPTDFTSLHDLKDLVNNYSLVSKLSEALKSYQRAYIDSHFMTVNEVLEYIPHSQHKKVYSVSYRYKKTNSRFIDYKKLKNGKLSCQYSYDLYDILKYELEGVFTSKMNTDSYMKDPAGARSDREFNPEDLRILIVDSINKTVHVCPWADPSVVKVGDDLGYTGKIDYVVENDTLIVSAHYTRIAHQTVGGVMINGPRGYLRGGTSVPYDLNGFDSFKFCTKTNRFLGYDGCKEDAPRPWIRKTSMY